MPSAVFYPQVRMGSPPGDQKFSVKPPERVEREILALVRRVPFPRNDELKNNARLYIRRSAGSTEDYAACI